ncbi:MAG: class I SAM-dependent methyltransferase [Bacteroidales bacterium]|jgi:ubiquinone/menaquinone biosynthesis C-methylase UbiE|nr:class I SAM-dependent methyltransferase [Bacteroidales bacterium]
MTVLDLGCGTGYFTLETAKLLDNNGKVIAADVQKGMLDILKQKLHVSKSTFNSIISKMENYGFEICEQPIIFCSRTVIMRVKQK